jgi:hypothetical protein
MDPMIVITLAVSLVSLVCVVALLVRGPQGIARRLETVDSRLQTCERGFLEGAVNARNAKQATYSWWRLTISWTVDLRQLPNR